MLILKEASCYVKSLTNLSPQCYKKAQTSHMQMPYVDRESGLASSSCPGPQPSLSFQLGPRILCFWIKPSPGKPSEHLTYKTVEYKYNKFLLKPLNLRIICYTAIDNWNKMTGPLAHAELLFMAFMT